MEFLIVADWYLEEVLLVKYWKMQLAAGPKMILYSHTACLILSECPLLTYS